MSQARLDEAMIDQLRDLLAGRFGELVARFIADGEKRLSLLRNALIARDYSMIFAEAHGLKGSCRNVGAGSLGDLCALLEAQGKDRSDQGLEQLFAAIEQEFAAVAIALQKTLD